MFRGEKTDLRIYEAIYHFNIYRYLYDLLNVRGSGSDPAVSHREWKNRFAPQIPWKYPCIGVIEFQGYVPV